MLSISRHVWAWRTCMGWCGGICHYARTGRVTASSSVLVATERTSDRFIEMGQLRDALTQLACTSTSCCVADGLCLPLDFLKCRMQLQNELVTASAAAADRLSVRAMAAKVI